MSSIFYILFFVLVVQSDMIKDITCFITALFRNAKYITHLEQRNLALMSLTYDLMKQNESLMRDNEALIKDIEHGYFICSRNKEFN